MWAYTPSNMEPPYNYIVTQIPKPLPCCVLRDESWQICSLRF